MFKVDENEDRISIKLSSRMELVDRTISEGSNFFRKHDIHKYDNLEILLRELLVNAVEHGNKNDITKTIDCEIACLDDKNRFEITIKDQGEGFDTASIGLDTRQDPTQTRGRGYSIINAYADEIQFENNGSTVKVFVTLSGETTYDMRQNGNECVITPSGDITAGNADKLRWILVDMLNKKVSSFVINCLNVGSIDSVSLSMLINFHKLLLESESECRITFNNVNRDINSLFVMTRMNEIFTVKLNEKDGAK